MGKRGIYAQFDEQRFLRLDLLSMSWIEDNVLQNRAIPINAVMSSLGRTRFLMAVLRAALGMEHNQPRLKDEDIQPIYEAYIEKTGDRVDLEKLLKDVYDLATKNPTKLKAAQEQKTEDPGGNGLHSSDTKPSA